MENLNEQMVSGTALQGVSALPSWEWMTEDEREIAERMLADAYANIDAGKAKILERFAGKVEALAERSPALADRFGPATQKCIENIMERAKHNARMQIVRAVQISRIEDKKMRWSVLDFFEKRAARVM